MVNSNFTRMARSDKASAEYGTPIDFYLKLQSIFKFQVDPCPLKYNNLGLPITYNIHLTGALQRNGLLEDWMGNTYINPPFGRKKGTDVTQWINKTKMESEKHQNCVYVMLLPARIESDWFIDHIISDPSFWIYVVKGRLKFYNPQTNANNDPHFLGSLLLIRGAWVFSQLRRLKNEIPGYFISQERISNYHNYFGS